MLPVLSHTALNAYQVCPRRFHHMYVLKDLPVEEKSEAQLTGTAVHEALKKRIKLDEPLPDEYSKWEPICAEISNQPYVKHTELKLGIHQDGGACDFFADGVWLRGALDLVLLLASNTALLFDWKTNNKVWEDPFELEIHGLLLKTAWPEIKYVTGHYVWLKHSGIGALHVCSDTDKTLKKIKGIENSIKRRLASQDWPPDEGPLCGWCPVPKQKCEFKREGRR